MWRPAIVTERLLQLVSVVFCFFENIFCVYLGVLSTYMYTICMPSACTRPGALDLLKLELWTVVSHRVAAASPPEFSGKAVCA